MVIKGENQTGGNKGFTIPGFSVISFQSEGIFGRGRSRVQKLGLQERSASKLDIFPYFAIIHIDFSISIPCLKEGDKRAILKPHSIY